MLCPPPQALSNSTDPLSFGFPVDNRSILSSNISSQPISLDESLVEYYSNRDNCLRLPADLEYPISSDNVELNLISSDDNSSNLCNTICSASFHIQGITCSSCVGVIENYLKSLPGILSIKVNLVSHRADVQFLIDEQTVSAIANSISTLGFPTDVIQENTGITDECQITLQIKKPKSNVINESLYRDELLRNGIIDIDLDLLNERIRVKYNPDIIGCREIIEILKSTNTQVALLDQVDVENSGYITELKAYHHRLLFCAIFALPLVIIMVLMQIPYMSHELMIRVYPGISISDIIMFICATPIQFVSGSFFYVGSWKALKNGRADMNVLIMFATSMAYLYSLSSIIYSLYDQNFIPQTFFDTSGMLIPIVVIGKYMEFITTHRMNDLIQNMVMLQSYTCLLVEDKFPDYQDFTNAITREIDVRLVERGDVLKVLPGSKIPTDGVVLFGSTMANESMISGENRFVEKKIGSRLVGGTINIENIILMKATHVGSQTWVAQIIQHVRCAQANKAPMQNFADKVAGIFVPFVMILSAVTFMVWFTLSLNGIVILNPDTTPIRFALLRAISVLVISCPCALGLATPTAVVVATSVGVQNGILFKGKRSLETLCKLKTIVFDKTGTVTYGTPRVVTFEHFGLVKELNITLELFAHIVIIAESNNKHPLAKPIVEHMEKISPFHEMNLAILNYQYIDGQGITFDVLGSHYAIGNWSLMKEVACVFPPTIERRIYKLEEFGHTCVMFSIDQKVVAFASLSDVIRPETPRAIQILNQMNIKSWLVTGDNERTAKSIADQVGIKRVLSQVQPLQKAQKIQHLQMKGGFVAMVGDGINDSPALSSADVGITLVSGTDIAIQAADVVLLQNNLLDLITAMDLSRKTIQRIKINMFWTFIYNIVGIPLAAGVLYPIGITIPPVLAAINMAFSSISVLFSSLLLKNYKRPKCLE